MMNNQNFQLGERFCIHYWLDDNSHSMNAVVQNRCEYEYLGIIREFAKIFNVEIKIETTPLENGGIIRWFSVLVQNGIHNPNFAMGAIFGTLITTIIITPVQETIKIGIQRVFEDSELKMLEKEKLKLEILKLKEDINRSSSNNTIQKRKSNFYEQLSKAHNVNKISYCVVDSESQKIGSEVFVNRDEFSRYLLATDELPSQIDEKAEIEIVAPVLKRGRYRWLGIYNGQSIPFQMKSIEFRQKVQNGEVKFSNGSVMLCCLKIDKKIDTEGAEIITGYEVVRVNYYSDANGLKETEESIVYKRRKKESRMQTELFDSNEDDLAANNALPL